MSDCTVAVNVYQSRQHFQTCCIQLGFICYFVFGSCDPAIFYI